MLSLCNNSAQVLAAYNGISNPNIISVGQKIKIPGSGASVTPATPTADPKAVWDFLMGKIGNAYGVSGLMGNLYAESAMVAINLQQTYEKSHGHRQAFQDHYRADGVKWLYVAVNGKTGFVSSKYLSAM